MRRGWRSSGPLTSVIVVGLLTTLVGCTAEVDAGVDPSSSASPPAGTERLSHPTTEPNPSPTPDQTLPPTLVEPSQSPVATPTAKLTPDPKAASRYDPPPKRGPFQMNIYRRGDFATQATKNYCVPGAMQTMMNVMDRGATKSSRTIQDRLYRLARRFSTDRLRGQGAEAEGWATGLQRLGYGKFEVVAAGSRTAAVRARCASHTYAPTARSGCSSGAAPMPGS